jgi:glucose-6-phosphate isomerase
MKTNEYKSWENLSKLHLDSSKIGIKDLFNLDTNRAEKFSIEWHNILFDYSKNRINSEIFNELIQLAKESNLSQNIENMYNGEKLNFTEKRAVLHTALRSSNSREYKFENNDINSDIKSVLEKMKVLVNSLNSKQLKGFSGKVISNVVNIGIGGSDLGPRMVCEALTFYHQPNIKVHFISNVDPTDIQLILKKINPEETLFLIASKTFTTQETMANAETAKKWILDFYKDNDAVRYHFLALSTNYTACEKFGISKENIFEFWDWVGGRFSLWSSIGLSIAIQIGWENFLNLLKGASDLDEHFFNADFKVNIPVVLALIGIWNVNFLNTKSLAVIPYIQLLNLFPMYLQQLEMESNGKTINILGEKINYNTSGVLFGSAGTNSQHSFFQLIHQGSEIIPVDFIAEVNSNYQNGEMNELLFANFLAQSDALAFGKTKEEVISENPNIEKDLINHKVFEGNRPSNSFLINKLNPENLGKLIAIYEHKVFVQGVIWQINSFDQWGVELGKQLAKNILPDIQNKNNSSNSNNKLLNWYKKNKVKS